MPDVAGPGSLYMGLLSGTSMDGIDAALVEFGDHQCGLRAMQSAQYPDALRSALLQASRNPDECTVDLIGDLDQWVGACFRDAAQSLMESANVDINTIAAIGSHGQTLRHQPNAVRPFTIQIGDPNVIASGTGVVTVADFRRADMSLGGQGAPLAPAFHQWLFADPTSWRVILNIGGIANVTVLPGEAMLASGFDTGPGNTLLDSVARENLGRSYDDGGAWAASGKVSGELLQSMLADEYFAMPPPKSTGFEYFNASWLNTRLASLGGAKLEPVDVQATLAELTARTMATAIREHVPAVDEIFICGGGAHNTDLVQRLETCLEGCVIQSTEILGLHPDWVEAAVFAWLAKRRLEGKTSNLPRVTGASRPAVLGAVY